MNTDRFLVKILVLWFFYFFIPCDSQQINRYNLVTRHNIVISSPDFLTPLTVGNGEFAYTVDITGMQSFPEYYEKGTPLGTQSQWGWHSFPNPDSFTLCDIYKYYYSGNDSAPYAYQHILSPDERKNKASTWLRENPHRMHLGLIGIELLKSDNTLASISDIQHPTQTLNLWTGEIKSRFEFEGVPVEIITYCHQQIDMISCRIISELLKTGRIKIKMSFAYGNHNKFSPGYDFSRPEQHSTILLKKGSSDVYLMRQLDAEKYYVHAQWSGSAVFEKNNSHIFRLTPASDKNSFDICCMFTPELKTGKLPAFEKTKGNNISSWEKFWKSGAAVDFSQCTDPRAFELERRIILSQYLTKIQCTGTLPPQETGLTYNSWHGKFHLEMHWWHAMHFILWGRPSLMEKQLNYYFNILDQAKKTAKMQGYEGVRWPKMVGPDGRESPSGIGPFLIWQQPHIIYFAEMLYQVHQNDKSVLNKYKQLVFATADFMASYARFDSLNNRYLLGPPLIPAQERFNPETTINPPFELAYWYWGLSAAQQWRKRLGMEPNQKWQHVIDHLSDLPVRDSMYLFAENISGNYITEQPFIDHPIVLGILGFLPLTEKINKEILRKTLHSVENNWNWESTWGWDYPLMAMTAAQLDMPDKAIDFLMKDTPKNRYLLNGHNYQDANLTLYLPGNGALLCAIAMMCACNNHNGNNGFPANDRWNVRCENFKYCNNCIKK